MENVVIRTEGEVRRASEVYSEGIKNTLPHFEAFMGEIFGKVISSTQGARPSEIVKLMIVYTDWLAERDVKIQFSKALIAKLFGLYNSAYNNAVKSVEAELIEYCEKFNHIMKRNYTKTEFKNVFINRVKREGYFRKSQRKGA